MTKEEMQIEWDITIALFAATIEQQSMLIGEPKQLLKVMFNRWHKEGIKLLRLVEDNMDQDFLEELKEGIENSVAEIKKNKIKRVK